MCTSMFYNDNIASFVQAPKKVIYSLTAFWYETFFPFLLTQIFTFFSPNALFVNSSGFKQKFPMSFKMMEKIEIDKWAILAFLSCLFQSLFSEHSLLMLCSFYIFLSQPLFAIAFSYFFFHLHDWPLDVFPFLFRWPLASFIIYDQIITMK